MHRGLYFVLLVLLGRGGRNGKGTDLLLVMWERPEGRLRSCGRNGDTKRQSLQEYKNPPDGVVPEKGRTEPADLVDQVLVAGTNMKDALADPGTRAAPVRKSS